MLSQNSVWYRPELVAYFQTNHKLHKHETLHKVTTELFRDGRNTSISFRLNTINI